jgi:hypothetical protein
LAVTIAGLIGVPVSPTSSLPHPGRWPTGRGPGPDPDPGPP